MSTRNARNQKAYRDRLKEVKALRKAKLEGLTERFESGTILRIGEADKWGIQEIKLILNPDAQEAGGELAAMFKMDVHEFMEEQLKLNTMKHPKAE